MNSIVINGIRYSKRYNNIKMIVFDMGELLLMKVV